jgi:hypothetical protein
MGSRWGVVEEEASQMAIQTVVGNVQYLRALEK